MIPSQTTTEINDPDRDTGIRLDQEVARDRLREESGKPVQPAGEPVQVASATGAIGKFLKGAFSDDNPTMDLFRRGQESSIPRASPEQAQSLREVLDTAAPIQVDPAHPRAGVSGINLARVHPGVDPNAPLRTRETAEDVQIMLEETAMPDPGAAPRTWASIKDDLSDPMVAIKELRKSLGVAPNALWNDKQLYNAANYMATLGQSLSEQTAKIKNLGMDVTDADLLKFQQTLSAFQGLALTIKGKRREAARALAVNRHIGDVLDAGAALDPVKVAEVMSIQGGPDAVRKKQEILASLLEETGGTLTIKQVDSFTEKTWGRKAVDNLIYVWKSMLLSHPGTHAVNFTSNAATQFYETVAVRGMAAAMSVVNRAGEAAVRKITRGKFAPVRDPGDMVYWDEPMVEAWAAASGLNDAIKSAGTAWKTGQTNFGVDKADVGSDQMDVGLVNLPFNALRAMDEMSKTMIYRKSMYSSVHRIARGEGLKGKEFKARVDELLTDPPPEIHDAAVERAKYETYTQEHRVNQPGDTALGQASAMIQKFRKDHFLVEFLIPFLNTPTNIVDFAIGNSALAPLTKTWRTEFAAGGARRDVAMGRLAMGSIITATVWQMHASGAITGAGPKNYEQRRTLEKTGWQPFSIRFGDTYIPYNRVGAQFGMVLGATASLMDGIQYSRTGGDNPASDPIVLALNLAIAMGKFAEEIPMLQGIGAIGDAMEMGVQSDDLGRFISSFAPNLLRVPTTLAGEDTNRAVHTEQFGASLLQNVLRKTPVLSQDLPPRRYWDGSPKISEGGMLVDAIGMFRVTTAKEDRATDALVQQGIGVSEPDHMVNLGGLQIDLLELDNQAGHVYDSFIKHVGEQRRIAVNMVLEMDEYQEADKGFQGTAYLMLQRALSAGRTAGLGMFIQDMVEQASDPDSKMTPAARATVGDLESFAERIVDAIDYDTLDALRETPEGQFLGRIKGDPSAAGIRVPPGPRF